MLILAEVHFFFFEFIGLHVILQMQIRKNNQKSKMHNILCAKLF